MDKNINKPLNNCIGSNILILKYPLTNHLKETLKKERNTWKGKFNCNLYLKVLHFKELFELQFS
jgi:hypothetical protein